MWEREGREKVEAENTRRTYTHTYTHTEADRIMNRIQMLIKRARVYSVATQVESCIRSLTHSLTQSLLSRELTFIDYRAKSGDDDDADDDGNEGILYMTLIMCALCKHNIACSVPNVHTK